MPNPSLESLPSLWLASGSPRRSYLLSCLGLAFRSLATQAEEADWFGDSVQMTVMENARRKAEAAIRQVPEHAIVIAADTLVSLDGQALSKPLNEAEAIAGLRRLSGQTHTVFTGLHLLSKRYGQRQHCAQTHVTFRALSDREIQDYVSTPEPYDKAGGYGAQGLGCLFIEKVDGSYSNVMGLPIEALLTELAALTSISPHRWFLR